MVRERFDKASKIASSSSVDETSHLLENGNRGSFYNKTGSKTIEDAYVDEFFPILEMELTKINNFYVGKVAELKLGLDLIQVKRDNWYQSHHTGNKPSDLTHIRDMYIECRALVSYQKLNRTGRKCD